MTDKPKPPKICKLCGKEYIPKNIYRYDMQVYCSRECQVADRKPYNRIKNKGFYK